MSSTLGQEQLNLELSPKRIVVANADSLVHLKSFTSCQCHLCRTNSPFGSNCQEDSRKESDAAHLLDKEMSGPQGRKSVEGFLRVQLEVDMQNRANLILAECPTSKLLGNGFFEAIFMARAMLGAGDHKVLPFKACIKAQAISIYTRPIAVTNWPLGLQLKSVRGSII
jgi:hypothetical protein